MCLTFMHYRILYKQAYSKTGQDARTWKDAQPLYIINYDVKTIIGRSIYCVISPTSFLSLQQTKKTTSYNHFLSFDVNSQCWTLSYCSLTVVIFLLNYNHDKACLWHKVLEIVRDTWASLLVHVQKFIYIFCCWHPCVIVLYGQNT